LDEALKRRHLILDVLHKLELNSGALKIVAWSICFEINVPFKMIRKEAQSEFQGDQTNAVWEVMKIPFTQKAARNIDIPLQHRFTEV
jgi:hypothetical protein